MKRRLRIPVLAAIVWLGSITGLSLTEAGDDPWDFLEDFTPLPSTMTRIGRNYVVVLFENRTQQQLAAVIFKAACSGESCEIAHRAGYAAANARGSNTRVYVEPGEEELVELMEQIFTRRSRRPY